MVETGDAHVTYSLKHKKHGEMNTCIQRATADRLTQTVVCICVSWDMMFKHTMGRKGEVSGGAVQRATPHPRSPCQNCRP